MGGTAICAVPLGARGLRSLFETGGFWYADPEARSPDIQFHLGLGSGIEAGVERLKNAGVTLNSAYLASALARHGAARLRPIRAAAPLIDPNYWSDPHDRKMSIEGLKIAREIMQQAGAEALRAGRAAARARTS